MKIDEESLEYLGNFMEVTDSVVRKILKHCKRYNIKPIICAHYSNWEDFCSDWCVGLGYTRTEARELLHGGIGEFLKFPNGDIIRFAI